MAVEPIHHIAHARDPGSSARSLGEVLGLGEPTRLGSFVVVRTSNGASLDETYLVPNQYGSRDRG